MDTLFGMICCFPIVVEILLHSFDPYHMFYLRRKCATILCDRTQGNAMKSSIDWLRSAFYISQ